ncbi:MAG: hypothetical protein DI526_03170 [Caulobacter segnis]|uniref:Uncharacterized protein n=2 Tax=Caulobacter segnis TaxID=88688 RepID=A0A2W5VB10_9CAUL|nr:MAG: hypothetical protein DI526_03170 [Caulobacter segnis]
MLRHGTLSEGERHANKLTEADARAILAQKGTRSQSAIAADFGITQTMVGRIHRRVAWKCLERRRAA